MTIIIELTGGIPASITNSLTTAYKDKSEEGTTMLDSYSKSWPKAS